MKMLFQDLVLHLYKYNVVLFRFFKKYNKILVVLICVNFSGQYQFPIKILPIGLNRLLNK
jgi:hypothetical protein